MKLDLPLAILLSALTVGCKHSSHGILGPRVIAENQPLAEQFRELTGMDANGRVFYEVYRKSSSEGIFTHKHLGSHGCFAEYIVRVDDYLEIIGTRSDTALSRTILLKLGYGAHQSDKAMAAIARAMELPCGGPQF